MTRGFSVEIKKQNIKFAVLLLITLTFSNCTAWPAISAILFQSSAGGGGGIIPLIPGSSSPTATSTSTSTSTDTNTISTIEFSSTSSNNLETSSSVTIPVTISSAKDATVSYTVSGTATGGGVDYTLANGTLTFTASGATTQNITFTVVNDAIKEANETVIVTLSSPSSGTSLGTNTVHTYTITDDDSAVVEFSTASSTGGEATTAVVIPVTISTASAATINYSVTGGTATGSGTDYTLASGTLTFTDSGATTQNIAITVNDDALYELDETIIITLSNATGANLGTNTVHTYTITNDDAMPTVAFSATSSSGAESVASPTLTVTLSAVSSLVTTVDYTASGASTASAGSDYSLVAGTLTFPAGTTTLTQTIPLTIVNDTNTEMNETVIFILSNAVGATLGTSSHVYTIEDNDPPSIAFATAASTGSESISSVSIPVSLSSPYAGTVSVDYSVTGGSATSGTDFTLASGTLLFTPGVSSQNITVTITNDVAFETNETIVVSLTNPTSGSGLGGVTSHTYTIVDDDTPAIAFNTMASNGNESVTAVTIPVSISLTADATVDYSVTGGSATGSGTDYTLAAGTLTFTNGGPTTQNISVTVTNDAVNELDETIVITLASPTTGINLGVNTVHTYTITNDDTAPTVAFTAPTSNGLESVTAVTIPVSLTGNTTNQTVTVGYSVTGGTATGSGTDFTLASGTLTFNPGTTTQNISVTVVNDTINETNETIVVTLASPTVSALGANTAHTYTITDNDTAPTVAFTATISNGVESTTAVTLPVTLTGNATEQAVTVDYSVTGGTATGGGTDFTLAAGTLTFAAGTTSQNVSITVVNEAINEPNETIVVTLSNPTISALGANTVHTYTITNDDTAPTVAFDATTSNGSEATAAVTIPVSLTGNSTSQTITVDYALTGTATGGGTDYTLAAGTLTFNPGTTTQNISATVINDGANESNETIILTLSNPSVATLGTNTVHTYTIFDDDTPSIAFNATASNGSEATTAVTIPVSISITATSSMDYAVTGGTATGGGTDFTLASGTLNFTNGGATTQNISITVNNDTLHELDETIIITLSNPTNANPGANTVHTYTITNDDAAPTVAFTATTSNGAESVAAPTLAVTLSTASGLTTTVDYSVTGGSATGSGTDFTLAAGTLTFTAGVTSQNITLAIVNDTATELNETIIVTLANPTNASLGANTAHTYTINDNDPPTVAFSATTSNGSEATTAVTIPVTLSAGYSQTITVDYSVTGGSATGTGTDFTLASGTLTYTAGVTSQNISITVNNDVLDETDETIVVTLASPTVASLGTNTAHTYTINDDDNPPTVAFSATTSNGSEATTAVTIPVTLSAASGLTTTVDYSVTGGTATGGGTDFTLAAGTLTYTAGVTSQNISVTVVNDGTTEIDETIVVTLSNPTNSTLGGNTAHTYTINDNDPPTVAFSATTSNGSEATTAVTIPVTLSAGYSQTITVGYSVTGGTATGTGTDYTLASGTLTYTAGVTSQDISITVVNDGTTEVDETIVVTLAGPTVASLGANTAHTYTINDNDPPTVAFSATTSNGSEATTAVTIPVTLSAAYSQAVTVGYSVTGGTATGSGTDFTLAAGTLTFVAGDTSENISITVVNDTLSESNETITVTLASPTVASLGTNTAHTYTINDNDTPNANFGSASSSGGEATTAVTIPVTLSFVSANTVTVDYTVTGGTATGGGTDYTLASGTLTYTAGVTSQDISITVNNDALDEANETIIITISNPTNAAIGGTSAHTYTINDDDPAPTIAFSTTTSNGSEATTAVTIPVTLSAASGQTVTVDYSVTGGTATGSGTDFTLASGTLTYTAGVTSQNISVTVINDGTTEVDETIVVTLSNPTNSTLGGNTAHTYTINDNDPPTVAFSATTSNGSEATTAVTIPVTLSAGYSQTVTVDYSVTGGTATGTETDYTLASGTLTYTAGVTSQNISITVNNDALDEINETIVVTLANPTVASLGANTAHTYTINDDDNPPTVAFSATTSNGSEATTAVTIPVTLSAASGQTVTVDYSVTGGTATGTGTDFTLASGTLTYTAGVTSQNISITVVNDGTTEVDETIVVTLASPTNSTLGGNTAHTYTINDNDPPTVAFSATTSNGSESTTAVTIPVTLSAGYSQTVTVGYSVTGGTATGTGTDFTLAAGTLTYTAGVTSQNISITVVNDGTTEVDETIVVTLASPTVATLGTNTAHTYTINDNDPPTVAFSATTSNGSEATTAVTIPVTLSAAYSQTVTVGFSVTGGTATGTGTDFTLASGTLTYTAGVTSQDISITVNNDALDETNETIIVTLASPTVASLGANTAHTYTINDDDATPTVAFSATTSNASEATTAVTIPVTLSAASGQTVTVDYSVTGGTATGTGTDFTLASGTLTYTAGVTSQDISITVNNDALNETNETIQITLANPTNSTLGTNTVHTYTINDNDAAPTVAFSATTSNGSEATTAVTIPVTLSAASGQTVTVDYSVTGGTATGGGTDFTLAAGTLTYTTGVTSQNISITVINDGTTEVNETIVVTLANPTNSSLGGNTAHTYTINDNDPPTVAFNATTSNGSEATTAVTIPVTLSAAYSQTVTVDYSVTGGTATGGGTDFTLASGTLTFTAGVTSQDISLTVVNDTATELNETIIVTLASPTVASLGTNTAHTYTINDNDPPTVAFSATTSNASEATTAVTIPVTLSAAYGQTVTVGYSVTGGTATGTGTDFTLASGTLTYTAGVTSQDISITVNNDSLNEVNETIEITLASPTNSTLGTNTVHTYTINDNDAAPTVAFSATTSNGSEATTAVTIPVTLSAASGQTVTVDYSVTGGTATGGGTDFTLAAGTLTYTTGVTSQNISITVINDGTTEVNETIVVTLANPTNSSLGGNTAHTYTINDNDPPTVAFNATTSNGSEATTAVTIPVTLSAAYSQTVTVDYSVTGGTATGGGTDFTLASGTLTFTAGVTSQDISLTVVNDTATELNETIIVTLASPTVASLGTNTAHTYTINDNDPPTVAFSATASNASETTTAVTIPVTLSGAYANTVTVDYSVTGGTATGSGTDFTLANGTLTFTTGVTSQDISITVVDDALNEANETIIVTLASPTVATLGTNTVHTYTINNDDTAPTVQFAAATSSSGDESSTTRTVAVSLSAVSGQTVTVTVTDTTGVGAGLAVSGTDYTAIGSPLTVTFTAGVTSQNVSIPVIQDLDFEGDETIQLTLSAPSNATLGGTTGHTFTITEDDAGIVSAETMDADNDGKIDHYKLTFSEAVNDSSFPGYTLNSAGSAQTDWLVAGYTGVVLAHGSAAPEADTANDTIIYLKFNEGGSSDTDAKPNLTTTATPTVVAASAKTIGRVYTATVVEADRAKPVIVSATAQIATTLITVTFSEPVWTASGMPACGAGGDIVAADFTYNNVSGNNASSVASMGADPCGTDLVVNINTNTALMPADNTDTIVAVAGIFDAANNNGNSTARTIVATGGPTVTNIQLFDTDKNGNIDQAKVTFSITMQDSSTGDATASQFTIGGTGAVKVDTGSTGTGVIASPNNDTGTSNDTIITLFTNNSTVTGTDLKTVAFTMAASKWLGNSVELQTIANLSSVTEDKAPPVILSAVAADNTTQAAGVDSDDTLVITFSEVTNKPTINTANIASIFSLSSSHAWGTITSATWNGAGDILTLTFSGAGSPTVAVGDYITILGTIADTATVANTSVNIASVAPITGNFYIDNIPPTLTNNFSVGIRTIRIVYSEPVIAAEAINTANYKVVNTSALAGTCAAGTNFGSSNQTADFGLTSIAQINSTTFELTINADQVQDKQYTLIVNKTGIHDLSPTPVGGNAMGCPNYGSFIGREVLKFASSTCVNRYSLILGFSKPYKTGVNTTGSAECNSTAECNARYKFTGVSNLGNITSAVALDGSVCGGAAADTTKICITHSDDPVNLQKGGVYTIIGANATNGDSFDNTIAIRDTADLENLQVSPKDRVSFTGCYATPDYFTDGAIINDPFGDGSTFGYLVDFNSKIYIGPNQKGNAAARFGYAGSNPESIGFNFSIDTTGSTKSNTNAGPFYSIGHSGCTTNINTIGSACGPDNEDGRGVFAVGSINSTQYLFMAGARTTPSGADYNFDYIYYTADTSTDLNLKYIDLGTITGTVTAGTSAIATFTDRLYAGFGKVNDSGSNAPDFGRINFQATAGDAAPCTAGNSCDATNGTGGIRFFINYMDYFGGNGATAGTRNYARVAGVDSLFVFNDRIYAANGGHPTLDHNGSIIRSASTIPAGCNTGTQTCSTSDWVEIGPRTNTKWHNSGTNNWYSLELSKFYDFIPADKAFPQMAEFNSNLYVVRNICVVANQGATTWAGSVSTTSGCLDGTSTNRRAQLWKCDPTASGVTTTCEAADWSLVGENGSTGFTDMGESTNTIITMVVKNGTSLYIGYDNSTGVRIYRTKVGVTNPTASTDFEAVGSAGLDGDTTNIQQIFSAISVLSGTDNYLYISAGKNSVPVKAYRHKN